MEKKKYLLGRKKLDKEEENIPNMQHPLVMQQKRELEAKDKLKPPTM